MAIATLSIDLVAKIASFEKDLQRAATASEAQSKRMAAAFEFVSGAIAGMAGALSVGVFASAIKDVAAFEDSMGKLAQRTNTTVEEFSALAYAAKLADVSNETLSGGLAKLSKLMTEAAAGGEKQKKILQELGTSETKDVNKAFLEIADRFQEFKDGAGKGAIASEAFGRAAGPEMLTLLNQGSEGIKAAGDEARRFGVIVTQESVVAAERFNDNLERLATMAQGAKVALLGDLVDGLGRATQAYIESAAAGSKWLGVMAAVQTFLTGDDQYKNDKAMVELTDRKLALENDISRLKGGDTVLDAARLRKKQEELKVVEASLKTTLAYRAVLAADATPVNPKAKTRDVDVSVFSAAGKSSGAKTQKEEIDATSLALSTYVKGLEKASEKTQNLTETEKALIFLRSQGSAGEIPQVRELVLGLAEQVDKEKQLIEVRKQSSAYFDGLAKDQAALEESNQKLREQVEEIGLTKAALDALTLSRLDNNIAQEQANVAVANAAGASQEEIVLMERKIKLLQEQRNLTGTGQIAQAMADTAAEQEKKSKEFADTLNNDVKSALSNAFRDSKDPLQAFGDALGNIVFTRLSTAAADALMGATFGGGGSGGFSLASLLSFDGGGYTGSGARAGGMDGKGGFLAMMHPNETVTDHTKGQSSGGTVNHYNFTVGDVASKTMVMQAISNAQKQSAAVVNRSNRYA